MSSIQRIHRSPTGREVVAARSVFGALTLLMIGYGLVSTLVGIRATNAGFPTLVIGLLTAAFYAGFVPGTLMASRFLGRVGHIRVFAALASVTAASVLLFPLAVTPLAWISLKFVGGFAIAGLYVVVESWLNAVSTNATRGRLLSIYLVVVNVAFGFGQTLLAFEDGSTRVFIASSVFFSLAVVPLTLSVAPAPSSTLSQGSVPLRRLARAVPLAVTASIVVGVATGTILGLGSAYGTIAGMSIDRVGVLMAAAMVGGLILQWPLGVMSDRYPRRRVILTSTTIAGLVALAAVAVQQGSTSTIAITVAFTAISFPMYSMAVSHMNDQIEAELLIPASAAMIIFYGLGSVVGPLVASAAIEVLGPSGFWWVLAVAHLALAPYAVYRLVVRRRLPRPETPAPAYPYYGTALFGLIGEEEEDRNGARLSATD